MAYCANIHIVLLIKPCQLLYYTMSITNIIILNTVSILFYYVTLIGGQ